MTDVTTLDWDRMYMFRPYTPRDGMKKVVGLKWSPDELSDDHLHMLVFVKGEEVVLDVTLDRAAGDFTQSKEMIERRDSSFVIEKNEEKYNYNYLIQEESFIIRNSTGLHEEEALGREYSN